MNKFLKKLKNLIVPHFSNFSKNELVFKILRKVYKFLLFVNGCRRLRWIGKIREIVEEGKFLRAIIISKKESGCAVEFSGGKKCWWRNPNDPNHLLSIIVNSNEGEFDSEQFKLFSRLLRVGDTVFDIGANFGWHSIDFGKIIGQSGNLYCFEPVLSVYEELVKNINLNFPGYQNIITERLAVGNSNGNMPIYIPREKGSAFASLRREEIKKYGENIIENVEMVTLDSYIVKNNIRKIDFIKCDVEGAELAVAQGAATLLGSIYAPMIYTEIQGTESKKIFDIFRNFGYASYRFFEDCLLKFEYDESESAEFNFLFVKDAHIERLTPLLKRPELIDQ